MYVKYQELFHEFDLFFPVHWLWPSDVHLAYKLNMEPFTDITQLYPLVDEMNSGSKCLPETTEVSQPS